MKNANEEMLNAIKILMSKSFWGMNSSMSSLVHDLRDEVREFVCACENHDQSNVKEEAADVLMIILCILYRVLDMDTFSPDDLAESVTEKLHWRYRHLYEREYAKNLTDELEIWKDAKDIEHMMDLMFCENKECSCYQKIGFDNINYINGKYQCSQCQCEILPSAKNTLFFNCKHGRRYLQEICESIVMYNKGTISAPQLLYADNIQAFNVLCNQLLNENDRLLSVLIEYVSRTRGIAENEVCRYFDEIKRISNKEINKSIIEEYYYKVQNGEYKAKETYTLSEWQRIVKKLVGMRMDICRTIERTVKFQSRNWNNQVIHKYLLNYPDACNRSIIECMTLLHYQNAQIRDLTIELSNMYSCVVGCRFCASGALPGDVKYLEPLDYVKQLNTCLYESGVDPSDYENFYVSFAGIGEPSVVYEQVAAGMQIMCDIYKNIKFNIATFGYRKDCFAYWNRFDFPIRTIQIPLYHINTDRLRDIVTFLPSDYDFLGVVSEASVYRNNHPMCQIKVNYIPMCGVNDSDEEVESFIKILAPFKDAISLKISYLNYTKPAEKNGFVTPGRARLEEICRVFLNHGFHAYVFGTEENTALGCGQLAQDCISGEAF